MKYTWKLSRNSTDFKENFIIRLKDSDRIGEGEIAPNVRYGETPESIIQEFQRFQKIMETAEQLDRKSFLNMLKNESFSHSFSFGVSSAHIHHQLNGTSVHQHYGLVKPQPLETSFTLPIMEISKIRDFAEKHKRFRSLKIKVSQESAEDMINEVTKYTDQKLRIDANEGWNNIDQFMKFASVLKNKNIEFVEQPFPAHCEDSYRELKGEMSFPIIADESVEDCADFSKMVKMFDGINVKLMKAGSYENAIYLLQTAREHGLQTMLGMMIESSIGVASGIELSSLADYVDLDGSILTKNEPFGYIKEVDGLLFLNN